MEVTNMRCAFKCTSKLSSLNYYHSHHNNDDHNYCHQDHYNSLTNFSALFYGGIFNQPRASAHNCHNHHHEYHQNHYHWNHKPDFKATSVPCPDHNHCLKKSNARMIALFELKGVPMSSSINSVESNTNAPAGHFFQLSKFIWAANLREAPLKFILGAFGHCP